ncbi:hypothetical protein D3C78_473830 [compost metagenome]
MLLFGLHERGCSFELLFCRFVKIGIGLAFGGAATPFCDLFDGDPELLRKPVQEGAQAVGVKFLGVKAMFCKETHRARVTSI